MPKKPQPLSKKRASEQHRPTAPANAIPDPEASLTPRLFPDRRDEDGFGKKDPFNQDNDELKALQKKHANLKRYECFFSNNHNNNDSGDADPRLQVETELQNIRALKAAKWK